MNWYRFRPLLWLGMWLGGLSALCSFILMFVFMWVAAAKPGRDDDVVNLALSAIGTLIGSGFLCVICFLALDVTKPKVL